MVALLAREEIRLNAENAVNCDLSKHSTFLDLTSTSVCDNNLCQATDRACFDYRLHRAIAV